MTTFSAGKRNKIVKGAVRLQYLKIPYDKDLIVKILNLTFSHRTCTKRINENIHCFVNVLYRNKFEIVINTKMNLKLKLLITLLSQKMNSHLFVYQFQVLVDRNNC